MEISLDNIKLLREKTGAGMVDCKKAMEESGGDIEKAVEVLRKKGIAKAAKRSEREAGEGVSLVGANGAGDEGYILEMNSETDFVARNEKFQKLAKLIFDLIKDKKPKELEELLGLKLDKGTVKEDLDNLSGTIGEKLGIKRFAVLAGACLAAYSHAGGRIGVLASLDKAGESELAKEIAMQIAAASPLYLSREEVPAEEIEKEKEIYRESLAKEGKPKEIIEKIIAGKLDKYFEEICLLEQEYIKEDKKKVKDILGEVKVEKFIRYSL
ncbi:MAG: translation elongation factor Ts [Patescibacteria group bacterium]|nr:translation elongation factor Ts [Patescibacteria group bacterium]